MKDYRSCLSKLKARIRSRARNWYQLDLAVKGSGSDLVLTLRDRTTKQTATETVNIPAEILADICDDERAFSDYADQIIERFVYPVRPLQLFED